MSKRLKNVLEAELCNVIWKLRARGFCDEIIIKFLESTKFSQCFNIVRNMSKTEYKALPWDAKFRLRLIVERVIKYDSKALMYALEKKCDKDKDIRNETDLMELSDRFTKKFSERCPKIISLRNKSEALDELAMQIATAELAEEQIREIMANC